MGLKNFIQQAGAGMSNLMAGSPQDPNGQPGVLDTMSASMPDVPAQGVWGILANFAKMRGNLRLSQLAQAKQEQERQLKMENIQSQIGSRQSENDLRSQQVQDIMHNRSFRDFNDTLKVGAENPGMDTGSPNPSYPPVEGGGTKTINIPAHQADVPVGSAAPPPGANIPTRNNNPLDVKDGPATHKWIGNGASVGDKATDGGNFLHFDNPDTGFKAGEELMRTRYGNMDLNSAMKKWSGGGYGAEVAPDIPSGTQISQMTPEQFTALLKSMATKEGYKATQVQPTENKFVPEANVEVRNPLVAQAAIPRGFHTNTNPEVTSPTGVSFKPPDQQEATSRALGMAQAEQNIKDANKTEKVGPKDTLVDIHGKTIAQGADVGDPLGDLSGDLKFEYKTWESLNKPGGNFYAWKAKLAQNPDMQELVLQMKKQQMEDLKQKAEDEKSNIDYYARALITPDEFGHAKMTFRQVKEIRGMRNEAIMSALRKADELSGGKFSPFMSDLEGDLASKAQTNYVKQQFEVNKAQQNLDRMLADVQEIQRIRQLPITQQELGPAEADLLGRHMSIIQQGMNMRGGTDLYQMHENARSLRDQVAARISKHVTGGLLADAQIQGFLHQAQSTLDTLKKGEESMGQIPNVQNGAYTPNGRK